MRTTDLGKTFGVVDLYKDDTDPTDVDRIEKAFSKLESNAARVFQILDDAEKCGRSSVQLNRSQLNCLRKFLFLIHYRNGGHARQFIEGHFDPLGAAMVEAYRVEYDLLDARAVWLRNVALLLEDEHWEAPSDERLLWTTRMDYKLEALVMQLGLYRAPPGTEFVLTENGLGLAEGALSPQGAMLNAMFPGVQPPSFVTLTQSFPITPRLVVVLRSTLLSAEASMLQNGISPGEAKRLLYDARGLSNTSYFHDLPITPSKTTYIPALPAGSYDWMKAPTKMTPEDRRKMDDYQEHGLLNGEPLNARLQDQFVFAIDNLTRDQAERVNVLRLTHCKETISFMTPAALLQSIDAFERDRSLSWDNKNRYASLKAKLVAEQALSSPAPVLVSSSSSATPATTPEPDSSTTPSVSAVQPPAHVNAVPLKASLPGLQGALKGKAARAVPASDSHAPDAAPTQTGPPPSTVQIVAGSSRERISPGEIDAERPFRSSDSLPGSGIPTCEVAPPAFQGDSERPGNLARQADLLVMGRPDLPSVAASQPPSATVTSREQPARVEVALPGLRGAFNRKPAAKKLTVVGVVLTDVPSSAVSTGPVDDPPSTVSMPLESGAVESVTPPEPAVEPFVGVDPETSAEQSFGSGTVFETDTTLETSIDSQTDVEAEASMQQTRIEITGGLLVEEHAVDEVEGKSDLEQQMEEAPASQDWDAPWWAISVLGVVAVPLLVFGGLFLRGRPYGRR